MILPCVALLAAFLLPHAQDTPAAREQMQEGEPAQEEVGTEALEDLVDTLEDPGRREHLLEQLRALLELRKGEEEAEGRGEVAALSEFFHRLTSKMSTTVTDLLEQIRRLPAAQEALLHRLQDPEERRPLLLHAALALGVVALSLAVAWLAVFLLRHTRARLGERHRPEPFGLPLRAGRLLLRLLVDLLPAALSLGVAFALLAVVPLAGSGASIAVAVIGATALHRTARAVLAAIFAPAAPEVRAVPLASNTAEELSGVFQWASGVAIWGYFVLAAARALGAEEALRDPLRHGYALMLLFTTLVAVLRVRKHLQEARATPAAPAAEELLEPSPRAAQKPGYWRALGRAAIGLWWVVALVYVLGVYLLWLSGSRGGFLSALRATGVTVAAIGAAAVLGALLSLLWTRLGKQLSEWASPVPAIRSHVPRYVAMLRTGTTLVLVVIALGFVLQAWGFQTARWFESELVQAVVRAIFGILLILLLSFAVTDASTALATSYLERRQRASQDSAKVRTLVPLANKAIKVAVTVLAVLTILSQLGIAVGPILASIGFLGLAIGFGAQSLVKDLISGVFNLLEDNVSVGDIVKLGETGGLVEAINIRTIQLRDLSGNVHTVPWGQIDRLTNLTKFFSCYLIECGVAYREDVDEVIEVLREIDAGLQKDPDFGPRMLEPIEILGLDRFEDSQVVVRARLKTRPREQWNVGREFNRRMKKAFDERGIEIPFPHRTIYMGQAKDESSPPLRVVQEPADGERSAP